MFHFFFQKWPKVASQLRICRPSPPRGWVDWNWSDAHFLHKLFFLMILSFWDIVTFINYCVQILQVFFLSVLGNFSLLKWCLSLKMNNVMIGVTVFMSFCFVRFLVFEILSILYFSDLDLGVAWQRGSVAWLCEICRWR